MTTGFVFVVMGITFWQENKTEKALDALRDLSSPRALVIREGQQERIAGRDVVRDDIVLVVEGDRVPADAWCFEATISSWTSRFSPASPFPFGSGVATATSREGNRAETTCPSSGRARWW